MTNRIVVAYDDSEPSKRALEHAIEAARLTNAAILVAHVLEWSPYSFLTAEELAERHKRRNEEVSRAKQAVVDPAVAELKKRGLEVDTEIRYGKVAETLIAIAEETGASQIIIGRTGHSTIASRVFGSVAGSLAQVSPVPVTIVP
ncbi:MAG: universal stress protein [Geminicoccaceae bacterium]|nr:MAG: universal stress protein [Geminicoccaceae bacterium]